jgi:hypothetical protein
MMRELPGGTDPAARDLLTAAVRSSTALDALDPVQLFG